MKQTNWPFTRLASPSARSCVRLFAALCLAGFCAKTLAQTNLIPAAWSVQAPAFHLRRVFVMPHQGTSLERLAEFHVVQRTAVLRRFPRLGNLQVLQLPEGDTVPAAVARYQHSGLVEFAEPDYRVSAASTTPDDPRFLDGTLWGLNNYGQSSGLADADVDAPEAWDIVRFATNVIVAIVDSGVRYTHEDLATNLWRNPVDGSFGLNAITGTTNVWDDYGHGTHLAGIIGAAGNNGKGVAGIAWQVQIMACKFLDQRGDGSNSDAVTCIEYARSNGATVINLSWGSTAFSAAVSNAVYAAQSDGILFAAAAGNDARDNDTTPFFPASLRVANLVSVSASTRQDLLWASSNYGDNSVDLFAPGSAIFSTTSATDSAYGNLNGTSMATAYVSGALALLRQQAPSAAFGEVMAQLCGAVDRPPALAGKCVTGGRLNLRRALDRVSVAAKSQPPLPLQLQMTGVPDHPYVLLASTNLTAWTPISTNTAGPDGLWFFTDLQSTNLPYRFYRGIPGP